MFSPILIREYFSVSSAVTFSLACILKSPFLTRRFNVHCSSFCHFFLFQSNLLLVTLFPWYFLFINKLSWPEGRFFSSPSRPEWSAVDVKKTKNASVTLANGLGASLSLMRRVEMAALLRTSALLERNPTKDLRSAAGLT